MYQHFFYFILHVKVNLAQLDLTRFNSYLLNTSLCYLPAEWVLMGYVELRESFHLRPNSPGPLTDDWKVTDDSSVNFHDVFFFIFCYNLSKNEEKHIMEIHGWVVCKFPVIRKWTRWIRPKTVFAGNDDLFFTWLAFSTSRKVFKIILFIEESIFCWIII